MGRAILLHRKTLGLFFFLSSTFMNTPVAFADINMMEASFQTNFIDLEIGGVKINRTYNSRSNFSGLFGFGWCSTLDAHLQVSMASDGTELDVLNDCGHTTPISGHVQRANGITRTFSATTGELTAISTETGPEIIVLRGRSRLPRDAALGEGLKGRRSRAWILLDFDDANENVRSIETSLHQHLEFKFSPSRDLLSARNAWANTYRHDYDRLHNLTQIDYPDRTSEKITYDSDLDRVLSFTGRDASCIESYAYRFDRPSSRNLRSQTSASKLVCDGHIKRTMRFDFTYKRNHLSPWTLSDLKITRGEK